MRSRLLVLALAVLLTAFGVVGCGHPVEEVFISPEPVGQNLGLGPGVRPLSFGPGDKSSPRWSPSGKRLAFVIDGYVVDKPLDSRDFQRRTTRDFGARKVEWLPSGGELAVLAQSLSPQEEGAAYRTHSDEEFLGVAEISPDVLAMEKLPEGERLILALKSGRSGSKLAVTDSKGRIETVSQEHLEGRITGFSVSPSGESAVLAARLAEDSSSFGLYSFTGGRFEEIARLEEGIEIIGAPQWTTQGIYYVAGEAGSESGDPALYDLYRIPEGREAPVSVSSIGEDFVASSLRVSPDGEMLAIIGRRSPDSPGNLYVLDLRTGNLTSLTANENMEIKTGPGDLAWSPNGTSIALIARGVTLSGPEVYTAPADTLLEDFYNVYEVPVAKAEEA